MDKHQGQILIADDNPANLRLYAEIFESQGYQCVLAEDGEQTISVALSCIPDLMIVSLELAKLGGLEVAERIQEESKIRHIPLIAIVEMDDLTQDLHQSISEAGFRNHLVKPFQEQNLLEVVDEQILKESVEPTILVQKQKA